MRTALSAAMMFAAIASAQNASPIPSYKSQEDYSRQNPRMPTCVNGKPFEMQDLRKGVTYERKESAASAKAPATTTIMPAEQLKVPKVWRKRGAPADVRLGELDWRLLQPDPDALIGLNVSALADSELARTLIGEWAGKLGATETEQKELLAALGDMPRAVISIQRKEMVAVLTGHVDNFPERSTAGGLQIARISADTVLMGPPSAVKWAVWRLNFALSRTPWIEEAQQLSRASDFWVWAKPQAFAAFGQGFSPNVPLTKVRLGVSFQDAFRMEMFLEGTNPAAAAKILEGSQKGAPRGMKAAVEGSAVHFTLALDRDQALERFVGFMADPLGKQFAPLLATARQIAARGAGRVRPAAGKIIIDGLDDGPRVVAAPPKQ